MGESADEILDALSQLDLNVRPDRSAWGDVVLTGPLIRALMRAEAELLVADAAAMQFGTYEERTPAQRRHDALLLIVHRLREHARAA
jgi:hypothetical protein